MIGYHVQQRKRPPLVVKPHIPDFRRRYYECAFNNAGFFMGGMVTHEQPVPIYQSIHNIDLLGPRFPDTARFTARAKTKPALGPFAVLDIFSLRRRAFRDRHALYGPLATEFSCFSSGHSISDPLKAPAR
jgi:hypothetical protein